jgi:hypothetical protein
MSKATKEKREEHKREFWCMLCDPNAVQDSMTPYQALAHVHEKHHITSNKGNKKALSFLDGDTYTNTYEWIFPCEVGAVKLIEVASGPKMHCS